MNALRENIFNQKCCWVVLISSYRRFFFIIYATISLTFTEFSKFVFTCAFSNILKGRDLRPEGASGISENWHVIQLRYILSSGKPFSLIVSPKYVVPFCDGAMATNTVRAKHRIEFQTHPYRREIQHSVWWSQKQTNLQSFICIWQSGRNNLLWINVYQHKYCNKNSE